MATSTRTKVKLTRKQVSDALEILAKWFPEEAENCKKHRAAIVQHLVAGTEPKTNDPLLYQSYAKPVRASASVNAVLSPCAEAIGIFLFDVVMLVLGLLGLHVSNQERIERALLRELGEDTLRGFQRAIQTFNETPSASGKAKALFAIFSGIYKAGGFRAVFKVLKDEMSWWEWLKTVLIAVVQIAAWVLSDGAAFIAEVVLIIMSAEQLLEDGIKAVNVCSESS